jgi:hypothetical protein
VAILKRLGLPLLLIINIDDNDEIKATQDNEQTATTTTARPLEERLANGKVLKRQPFSYVAVRYATLVRGLCNVLPADDADGVVVVRGQQAVRIEQLEASSESNINNKQLSCRVHFKDDSTVEPIDCDLVICDDGPRSMF